MKKGFYQKAQDQMLREAVKPPTPSERQTQNACIEYLMLTGWAVVETSQRWAADPRMAGLPDVLAFRAGVTLLLEMKAPSGKVRPSQKKFAELVTPHVAGTLVYAVIRSIDELFALLK